MKDVDILKLETQAKRTGLLDAVNDNIYLAMEALHKARQDDNFIKSCDDAIDYIQVARKIRTHIRVAVDGLEKDDASVKD